MNTNTRKICQFCRYKSCLAIGMRPKWVLSDDERHQKYGSRRKQNKAKPGDQISIIEQAAEFKKDQSANRLESLDLDSDQRVQPQTPSQGGASQSDEDGTSQSPKQSEGVNQSGSYSSGQKSELNRQGIDGMDTRPHALNLNSYEKDLIDRLSIAFYHSRKYNSIDLNVQKKMAMLFQTQSEGSLKKMSKVILANFIVQPVIFSKKIFF